MATKSRKPSSKTERSRPQFPYTNTANDLRRILQLVPMKPRPAKLSSTVIKTWGILNNNAYTALAVLKELGLIANDGTPTEQYAGYMSANSGAVLAQLVKTRYQTLFDNHENPQNASNEELTRFFNINSGGSEVTVKYQVQTFKVLSEFCRFDLPITATATKIASSTSTANSTGQNTQVHFDLHIHLPESKAISDYEAIIRSISEHIVLKVR